MKKIEKVLMTDEARNAVRYSGPTDKQLLDALLSNDEDSIPSSRHIRWMAAEILKHRKWTITYAYVGGKRVTLSNAILLAPGEKIKGRHVLDGVESYYED
jgi:hypothetical protein